MQWKLCFFPYTVLLICAFGLLHCSGWTIPDRRYVECPGSATFTTKSSYQQNLNELILHLTEYGPRTGFTTATKGTGPDQVYGLALCRGDISSADCNNCLGFAAGASTTGCPLGRSAIVYMEKCFLRYDDTDFFGRISITVYVSCSVETVSDTDLLYQQLSALMQNLSAVAAADPSRMFAVGEIGFNNSQKIYGLVQCKRDLSAADCRSCLGSTIAIIPNKCPGTLAGRYFGYSCDIRYEAEPFALGSSAAASPPGLVRPPPNSPGPLAWILPISVFTVSILFIGFACLLCRVRRRRERKCNKADESDSASLTFGLDTIKAATDNFSELNKIGQGGFGSVYRGKLPNGQAIAVKRLSSESCQGTLEFQNEVQLVAKLQHNNLVRLLGCCAEGGERILIYEYAANGSLDKFLFDPDKREHLRWETRLSIIKGIAKGLLYLHEDSRLRIIHRDLKTENILLDEEMKPKISDFGLARLFEPDVTHESTRKVAGTCGYMAPEYAISGLVSTKADVFSFGVLLLEIVSGQRITAFHPTEFAANLLSYAYRLWGEGRAQCFIDETIIGTCQSHEALGCIHIGLLCVQQVASDRPTMGMVALMFGNPSMILPPPSAPPFFFDSNRRGPSDAVSSSASRAETSAVPSIDEMTISELEVR